VYAADTTLAIASAYEDHPHFSQASTALHDHRPRLAGYAAFEAFSVLTRLPPGWRLSAANAAALLRRNFPGAPLWLTGEGSARVYALIAESAVLGNAVYDALVAQAALDHDRTLLTLDRRAERTYQLVGVNYELLR
jgi:predicted nucleic acid-binding protein